MKLHLGSRLLCLGLPFIASGCRSAPPEHLIVLRPERADQFAAMLSDNMAVGTLYLVAGNPDRLPAGWVACVGQDLLKEEYPELFAAIGLDFTRADTSPERFTLPRFCGAYAVELLPGSLPWFVDGQPTGHSNLVLRAKSLVAPVNDGTSIKLMEMAWVVKAR
jgi:hypothetical protein